MSKPAQFTRPTQIRNQTREIAKLPAAPEGGSIGVNTVNADETLWPARLPRAECQMNPGQLVQMPARRRTHADRLAPIITQAKRA